MSQVEVDVLGQRGQTRLSSDHLRLLPDVSLPGCLLLLLDRGVEGLVLVVSLVSDSLILTDTALSHTNRLLVEETASFACDRVAKTGGLLVVRVRRRI